MYSYCNTAYNFESWERNVEKCERKLEEEKLHETDSFNSSLALQKVTWCG